MFSQRHLNLRTLVHTIHLHEGFTGGSHSTSAVAALCKSTEAPAASILVAKSFCKPITTPCSLLSQTFSAVKKATGWNPPSSFSARRTGANQRDFDCKTCSWVHLAISFARSLFADSVSKTVNLALPYSLHVCSGCASHGIWRIALILVKVI